MNQSRRWFVAEVVAGRLEEVSFEMPLEGI